MMEVHHLLPEQVASLTVPQMIVLFFEKSEQQKQLLQLAANNGKVIEEWLKRVGNLGTKGRDKESA
jgi:hypothetical protein